MKIHLSLLRKNFSPKACEFSNQMEWGSSFSSQKNLENAHNVLRKNIEATDSFQSILVTHAVFGKQIGFTGSALGSDVIQYMQDEFPSKSWSTFSVVPPTDSTD